jgi:7-carboxy-7-deazaguanine synthase
MNRIQDSLRITEIFYSLQGESTTVGLPTVFIRTTGCPLRCQYCDTAYAFHGGERMSLDDILQRVQQLHGLYVCVTGGEPLAQPTTLALMTRLCDAGYHVSIETSGAMDCSEIDQRVMIVMDLKTPDSGECEKNKWSNLDQLKPQDQIKFVLCSRADYEWACAVVDEHQLTQRVQVLFSPSFGQLNPTTLANWILDDPHRLVRFQLQLHKLLWNDAPGH